MQHFASFVILGFLLYSRSLALSTQERKRKAHVKWICGTLLADLALVAWVAVSRRIDQSLAEKPMTILLAVHLTFAITSVVGYLFAFYYGFRLFKGHESARRQMRWIDRIVTPARIATFVTSLLVMYSRS